MKYRVRHVTTYEYGRPVDLAAHMLHLLPRALPEQNVQATSFVVAPQAGRVREGVDHFGNRVAWVFLELPHERFEITMQSQVTVDFAPPAAAAETPPWEEIAALAEAGGPDAWHAAEFAFESPMVVADAATAAFTAASFPPGRPILQAALDLTGRIYAGFTFKAGVTTVQTPVTKVMAQRAGVCQDFTHLMIAGLRSLGLPSRYVSGYLRTRPPAGQPARRGADQSHAWVGVWLGPRHGWVDLDPTNNLVVRDEHVVLGWGRDYGDISPVRGVILGGGRHTVKVGVDLEPV